MAKFIKKGGANNRVSNLNLARGSNMDLAAGGSSVNLLRPSQQNVRASSINVGGTNEYTSQGGSVMTIAQENVRPLQSLNMINPSPQNVERLFYEAC